MLGDSVWYLINKSDNALGTCELIFQEIFTLRREKDGEAYYGPYYH